MNNTLRDALLLVAITDDLRDGADGLVHRAAAAARGGATMIQVRLKGVDARTLVSVTRRVISAVSVPVVVNDRADVAIAAGAAGVHVGFDDVPVHAIRRFAPPTFIIGASLGSSAEADNALQADYVGIGPLFTTATKADAGHPIGTDAFRELRACTTLPAVAIGGITSENAAVARAAGADGVAAITSLFGADDVEDAARRMRQALQSWPQS
jgi:thiamine-phosphate pyrophosphorylase